jgi:hypothetical protein
MPKSLVLLVFVLATSAATANIVSYSDSLCLNEDSIFMEDNTDGGVYRCRSRVYSNTAETGAGFEPRNAIWDRISYARKTSFLASNCQGSPFNTVWYRLNYTAGFDGSLYAGGPVKALCGQINGKNYFYQEDDIGNKYLAKETDVCAVDNQNQGIKHECFLLPTGSGASSSSSSSSGGDLTQQQQQQQTVASCGVRRRPKLHFV